MRKRHDLEQRKNDSIIAKNTTWSLKNCPLEKSYALSVVLSGRKRPCLGGPVLWTDRTTMTKADYRVFVTTSCYSGLWMWIMVCSSRHNGAEEPIMICVTRKPLAVSMRRYTWPQRMQAARKYGSYPASKGRKETVYRAVKQTSTGRV